MVKKVKKKRTKKPKCTKKSYSCGMACISVVKVCRKEPLSGQSVSIGNDLLNKISTATSAATSKGEPSSDLGNYVKMGKNSRRIADGYPPMTAAEKAAFNKGWDKHLSKTKTYKIKEMMKAGWSEQDAKALTYWVSAEYPKINGSALGYAASKEGQGAAMALQSALKKAPKLTEESLENGIVEFYDKRPKVEINRVPTLLHFEDAVATAPPGKINLTRGMSIPPERLQAVVDTYKGKDSYVSDAYVATTFINKISDSFGENNRKFHETVVDIKVQGKIDGTGEGKFVDPYKNLLMESEILFPVDTKFKINKAELEYTKEAENKLETMEVRSDLVELRDAALADMRNGDIKGLLAFQKAASEMEDEKIEDFIPSLEELFENTELGKFGTNEVIDSIFEGIKFKVEMEEL